MEVIKWALIGLSLPVIGWLLVKTRRNARMLSERIDDYKREQEQLQKQGNPQGGPINPYEQIAQLYQQEDKDKNK
jgi:hypothetical protein